MTQSQLELRRKLYFEVSSQLSQIDNARLGGMFDNSEPHGSWGKHQVMDVGGSKVFVKRVPVTQIEYENMFSTRNMYELPAFYNYGYGSVGLGVWRELVMHIKTTNWVLAGEIATFPLMYHYRIVPFDGVRADMDAEQHARYVAYWGVDDNIGRYMLDRARAEYELVLFLEYVPHDAATWLLNNPPGMSDVIEDMEATVAFLRKKGIIHFDAHFLNILTDGKQAYLTDFGLVLDRHFDLTSAEKQFYRQNTNYDYGLLLWNLGAHVVSMYHYMPEAERVKISERYCVSPQDEYEKRINVLLSNLGDIVSNGFMKVDQWHMANLAEYESIITLMHDFRWSMRKNNAKDDRFPNAKLGHLLKKTGFVPGRVATS
jgi:hypothetical protein